MVAEPRLLHHDHRTGVCQQVGEASRGGEDSAAHRNHDVLVLGGVVLKTSPELVNELRVAGVIMAWAELRLLS